MYDGIIEDWMRAGGTIFDFTIGDEPYKLTFGAEPMPVWQMTRSGSLRGFAASVAVSKFPAVRALARNIFHHAHDKNASARSTPALPVEDEAVEV